MSLIPWTPFLDTFDGLEKSLNNFVPAVDVYEDKENVFVEATLAGMKPEDVSINIHDDVLSLEGSRASSSEIDEKNYYRKEVRTGSFHRAIVLPVSVQGDKAQASFKNGLLKITLPKEERAKSKNIKINIESSK
ncbi:MAG: Hsp20/alpha crystallin family protein [Patescibacteria group bacterium]